MQIEATQEHLTLTSPNLGSLNVLVVDDEEMIREPLTLFLESLGVNHIQTAENGEAGLQEFEENEYDFVFMDLMMPGIGGMEALKRMNGLQKPANIILMTGYPSMDVVIEAMHCGASDFLVKPFKIQDIKMIFERLLKLHILMEKNWLLHQELEDKKKVEELNDQLQKQMKLQSLMFNIVDSLSHIKQSDDLYQFLVEKAIESCDAKCACFMIHDPENSNLLALAHHGLTDFAPGTKTILQENGNGQLILDNNFINEHLNDSVTKNIYLNEVTCIGDFMSLPLNIRNESFGVLLASGKNGGDFFNNEDQVVLQFLAKKTALNIENLALYSNLKQSMMASLMSLVSAIEAKDSYTRQHSTRVTELAIILAENMGSSINDIEKLNTSGPLHDIGKIGIVDSILNKPGRLTDEEYKQIKAHPLIGENIVTPLSFDKEELAIIRNHHERWDGKGYPDGLKGEQIPKLSRILAVADSFDAMNSNRAYRKSLPFSVCMDELRKNSGTQFDPSVVEVALSAFKEGI